MPGDLRDQLFAQYHSQTISNEYDLLEPKLHPLVNPVTVAIEPEPRTALSPNSRLLSVTVTITIFFDSRKTRDVPERGSLP